LLTDEGLVSETVEDVSQPLVIAAVHTTTAAAAARPRNP